MDNIITIEDLYKGKPTIIKNNEFLPTKHYVEPFINQLSKLTDNFLVQVKTPDQMTFNKDSTDITYNRVLIQAVLPEKYTIDNHDEVIGFVYGIDVRRPVAKIYRGHLNRACTNLTVFNPSWIEVQEIIPGEPLNYSGIKSLLESTSDFAVRLEELKNTYVDRDLRKQHLGEWVDYSLRISDDYGFGKVKLAISTAVDAYKQLYIDQDSPYYVPEGIDPDAYQVYNSFTQIITNGTKRDVMNSFEKTVLVGKMLQIIE